MPGKIIVMVCTKSLIPVLNLFDNHIFEQILAIGVVQGDLLAREETIDDILTIINCNTNENTTVTAIEEVLHAYKVCVDKVYMPDKMVNYNAVSLQI